MTCKRQGQEFLKMDITHIHKRLLRHTMQHSHEACQLTKVSTEHFTTFSLQLASPGGCHIKTKALFLFILVLQGRTKCVFVSGKTLFSRKPSLCPSSGAIYCSILGFSFHQRSWCNQSDGREHYKFVTGTTNTPTLSPTQGRDQFTVTRSSSNWGNKLCKSNGGDIKPKIKPFSTACSQDWQQTMSLYSSRSETLEIM